MPSCGSCTADPDQERGVLLFQLLEPDQRPHRPSLRISRTQLFCRSQAPLLPWRSFRDAHGIERPATFAVVHFILASKGYNMKGAGRAVCFLTRSENSSCCVSSSVFTSTVFFHSCCYVSPPARFCMLIGLPHAAGS